MLSSAISYALSKEKKEWRTEGGGWERKDVRVGMGESIGGKPVDRSGTSRSCMGTKSGAIRWGEHRS